ncbi:MAG: cation:proton antiporter [Steroidobacteraceae bacterium]|jgi:CPA1 family monovalent cation:H+ antiporter
MALAISELGILLFVSALVAIIARRLRMPYSVGLVLAGMGLYFSHVRLELHLTKDLIFVVLLPPLVFEAALCISWREFKKDLPVVTLLATVGVLLAGSVTAAGMHYALNWGWGSAIVFGVLIAATDPVSVIAALNEAGVQGRLRLLIEAESLLNDGTAAVAFVAVLSVLAGERHDMLSITGTLLLTIGGGVFVGAIVGWGFMLLAGRTPDRLVEITLTTLAAYGSFFVAEHYRLSGVLAALTAGLVVGNYGRHSATSDADRRDLESFWEFVAFIASSLIFILMGAQEAQQHISELWGSALIAIGLVTCGRAISIYPLCGIFARTRFRMETRDQHVLFWGGLRGALALALALTLPQDLPERDAIIRITFAVVAFSVFAQGLTITPLLRRLGQLKPDA